MMEEYEVVPIDGEMPDDGDVIPTEDEEETAVIDDEEYDPTEPTDPDAPGDTDEGAEPEPEFVIGPDEEDVLPTEDEEEAAVIDDEEWGGGEEPEPDINDNEAEITMVGAVKEGDVFPALKIGSSLMGFAPAGWGDRIQTDVDLASQAAEEAKAVAEATGQHFWEDANGAHVTEITQDEWKAEEAKPNPFADVSDAKPYHNLLMNSLGILLRTALKNLVSITRSAIAFFDGQGNDAANVVASFGKDGAQIGKAGGVYVALRNNKFELNNADSFKPTQFGLLNDADTGLATLEESKSATYLYDGGTLLGCGITVSSNIHSLVSVTLNGSEAQAEVVSGRMVVVDGAAYGDEVTAVYTTKATVSFAQFGRGSIARGVNSFASGTGARANGQSAFAEGDMSRANGFASHAEGSSSSATGFASHAEGHSDATGDYAHSEGYHSTSEGSYSHAEGFETNASGYASHAEGGGTMASGMHSHAQNHGTKAASADQTALGKYNVEDANGDYALIIGNGTDDSNRSNALTVDWDGNTTAKGGEFAGTVKLKSTNIDRNGSNPSSAQYSKFLQFDDKDGDRVGVIAAVRETDGRTRMSLYAYNDNGDTEVYNSISIYVAKDGTRTYSVANPAAFCTALHVGDRVEKDQSTTVSMANSTYANICSISLPAGTWVIEATAQFANNATGRRFAFISATSASSSGSDIRQTGANANAVSGSSTLLHCGCTKVLTATTTIYLIGWQNSGEALSTYGCITAVRIK